MKAKDYMPPTFFIPEAKLHFDICAKKTIVTSRLHIQRNFENTATDIVLDGEDLNLQQIKINNKKLNTKHYKTNTVSLTIFDVPDNFILETKVIIEPHKNIALSGLYISSGIYCTQCESHGFRRLTYFIDRPDILTKFTTTIVADKKKFPILLSNGNKIAHGKFEDPLPKSAYLFALIAGDLPCIEDQFITKSGRKVKLQIYAEQKYLAQCHYAMRSLKLAMRWDEKNFGCEYDLDNYVIVAISDFVFGAMENKGLNIFNISCLLASDETATDTDHVRVASVVAHEYFHNWTGNRITCRDWFQLGLKEGLTTFREQLFTEDTFSKTIERIESIKLIKTRQFAEDASPMAHPIRLQSYIEVNNFYTVTVYEKGAEVARMLQTILGKNKFRHAMKVFFKRYDGKATTIENFLNVVAEIGEINLDQFKLWYDQSGTPIVNISSHFNAAKKTFTLKTKQELKSGQLPYLIPFAFGLIDKNGKDIKSGILNINKNTEAHIFTNIKNKPVPSLLRNFSAPIKINYKYTDNELLFILMNDSNEINRWEASQTFTTNLITKLCNKPLKLPTNFIATFKTLLINHKSNPALTTKLLELPTENYLFEYLPNASITTIHKVSEFIKFELATKLKNEFIVCYRSRNRSLKNLCLAYLMHLNNQEVFELCEKQLNTAKNMTDIVGSLIPLASSNHPNREQLLDDFYEKWQHHNLIVSKWLTINATAKHDGTLQRVKKLTRHPAFNIKNPNNVYALIRNFCENNLINFHREDGTGYKFLAEHVLTIDDFNPQLAAAIALPLIRWKKLDRLRQKLIKEQLVKISKKPQLSKGVHEIVTSAI